MADISQPAFDLHNTYVHLEDGGAARHIPVGPDFWAKIGERADLHAGRLATSFRMTDDWDHWEMHPAGDELIVLVSGAVEFRLQNGGGERTVEVRAPEAYLVPRGTWHTARVLEACDMVVITAGAGTQVRPLA
jgi:mannose-6-phosphate isomerase-like protein (cupin superfamily)